MVRRACKQCKRIYEGDKCPKCQVKDASDSWKGRIIVLNAKESEIAKKIKLEDKGTYAIKTK